MQPFVKMDEKLTVMSDVKRRRLFWCYICETCGVRQAGIKSYKGRGRVGSIFQYSQSQAWTNLRILYIIWNWGKPAASPTLVHCMWDRAVAIYVCMVVYHAYVHLGPKVQMFRLQKGSLFAMTDIHHAKLSR